MPPRSPRCRVVRTHCRRSSTSKRGRPCVRADGVTGNTVRTHVSPKGCTPDALRTLQRAARASARRRASPPTPPPSPPPPPRRVRFDASASKRDTATCVRLPLTHPRFRALFKTAVPMFVYLQNVFRECVKQTRDAYVVDSGLEEYARARRDDGRVRHRVVARRRPGRSGDALLPRAARCARAGSASSTPSRTSTSSPTTRPSGPSTRGGRRRATADDALPAAESDDPTGLRGTVKQYAALLRAALARL